MGKLYIRTKAILGDSGLSDKVSRGIATQQLWFLTSSPIINSPIELFPLLRALDPAFQIIPELESIENFRDRYCGWQETPWGISYKGGRNLPELRRRLRKMREDGTPRMVRRTKLLEVLKDLPDKRHQL
jgi:SNF2 family DNA or RNA helicase